VESTSASGGPVVEGEVVGGSRDAVVRPLQGKIVQYSVARDPDEWVSQATRDLALDGVPETTQRTYRGRWKVWVAWCAETRRQHLPAVEESVAEFIESCWRRTGRAGRPWSPSTVRLCLDVIAVAHRNAARPERDQYGRTLRGYESPTRSQLVKDALRGYRRRYRKAGHRPDKAHAFSLAEVEALIATCDVRSPYGLLHALVLALTVDAGFRRAEVVAINWTDVEVYVEDEARVVGGEDFLRVHVPESKTDQAGEGDDVVLYAHPADSAGSCPVRLFLAQRRLFRERDIPLTGALLRTVLSPGSAPADGSPRKGKITETRLPAEALERILAKAAAAAGVDRVPDGERPRHIAPHGLRAAGVTIASEVEGVSTAAIYRHFRFSKKSPVGLGYMRSGAKKSQNPMRKAWATRQVAVDPTKESTP
jgi:integrase